MIYFFDVTVFFKKIFSAKEYDYSTYLKKFYAFNWISMYSMSSIYVQFFRI